MPMKKLIYLLICTLFTACTQDYPPSVTDAKLSSENQSYRVSPEESVTTALSCVSGLSASTRSGIKKEVKSIDVISSTSMKTRSSNSSDTLLYVVNFENDEGFAIVGADKRMPPIYAVSDEGNFDIDVTANKGLIDVMTNITLDAQYRISDDNVSFEKNNIGIIDPSTPFPSGKYGPYLSYFQSRVGPTDEFSAYCPIRNGVQTKTGCVPIAVEMLMSFYKWPTQYSGFYFDWKLMNSNEGTQPVAQLLEVLGRPENLNVSYHTDGTVASANHENSIRTLNRFGYHCASSFLSFFDNEELVRQHLNEVPLLIRSGSSEHKSGHMWVIDGYLTYYTINTPSTSPNFKRYMYHCVWGDSGRCNGYYYVADSKRFWGEPDQYDPVDDQDPFNEWDHRHDIDIIFLPDVGPQWTIIKN